MLSQPQLELLIRPGYRASIDYSIKATFANLPVADPHYIEGRDCDGNRGTKIWDDAQTGFPMRDTQERTWRMNQVSSKMDQAKRGTDTSKWESRVPFYKPSPEPPLFLVHSVLDSQWEWSPSGGLINRVQKMQSSSVWFLTLPSLE